MSPKPTLSSHGKHELEAVGVGVEGQPQVFPRRRDKSLEKTVRSNNHNNQPKKDRIMSTETASHAREHKHTEGSSNAAETDPVKVGQQLDETYAKIKEMHAHMVAQDTNAVFAKRTAWAFGAAFLGAAGGTALVSWLMNRKTASVTPEVPAPIPITNSRRAA